MGIRFFVIFIQAACPNKKRFAFSLRVVFVGENSCNKLLNSPVALMVCTPSAEDFLTYAHQALAVAVDSHLLGDLRDASLGHLRLQLTQGDQLGGDLLFIKTQAGFLLPNPGIDGKDAIFHQMIPDRLDRGVPPTTLFFIGYRYEPELVDLDEPTDGFHRFVIFLGLNSASLLDPQLQNQQSGVPNLLLGKWEDRQL